MRYRYRQSRAFTLVELMISLGIALLLIYGVNLIFRAVTDTIKTGNALAVATRKLRSIDSALSIDFEGTLNEYQQNTIPPTIIQQRLVQQRWSGIAPIMADIDPSIPTLYADQPRQPAITIFCNRQVAFLNKTDEDADIDKNAATFDENENGVETDLGENFGTTAATFPRLNQRAHRVDTLGFFSGGSFPPHAIPGGVASSTAGDATQAWVWYGHALQHGPAGDLKIAKLTDYNPAGIATNPGQFFQPGFGTNVTNTRNFYASDWVLGRMAMTLLRREGGTAIYPGVAKIARSQGQTVPQAFAETGPLLTGTPTGIDFNAREQRTISISTGPSTLDPSPATADSLPVDQAVPVAASHPFTSSLVDVVSIWPGDASLATGKALLPTGSVGTPLGTPFDPALFDGLLRRYYQFQTGVPTWWQRSMLESTAAPVPAPTPAVPYVPLRFNTVAAFSRPVLDEPRLSAKDKASLQATYLAQGCSQFIVEFAGDFCSQNAGGGYVGSGPDGILDYVVSGGVRSTRWYGLPRDVDGNGDADPTSVDVVPFQTFSGGTTLSFEKYLSTASDANQQYVVAFGPADMYSPGPLGPLKPALIRLTVTLVDAGNSLSGGITREFVFKVR